MRIEFDPAKNERNIRYRGLSFDRAGEMDFAAAVTVEDTPAPTRSAASGSLGVSRKTGVFTRW